MHTRTASAIVMPPPERGRLLRGGGDDPHHERGDQHREDRDEGIVRQLRDPGLEEALGGLEEQQRDEEGAQGQEHRERDLREREEEHRVDRGQPHDQVDGEPREVIGEDRR